MDDFENGAIAEWLDISAALMRHVLPSPAAAADWLEALTPTEHAALFDSERQRVDHALVAMATASGEAEVCAIAAQLDRATLMSLASRWAQYTAAWQSMRRQRNPHLWVPPRDVWRAVLLAMTSEGIHSTSAAAQLWPEHF